MFALALALTTQLAMPVDSIPRGCYMLAPRDLRSMPHGWLVIGINRFFPYDKAVWSGDQRFWLCTAGRGEYVLFIPRTETEGEDE